MLHLPEHQVVPYAHLDRLNPPTSQIGEWQAFSHSEIADALLAHMRERGLSPGSGKWWVSPSGMQLYGVITVGRLTNLYLKLGEPIEPCYLLVNDATGRDGVRLSSGAWMTETSTGVLTREIPICRQFKNVRPVSRLKERFGMLRLDQVGEFVLALKKRELTDAEGSHLILQAHDKKLISLKGMFQARKYWAEPRFGIVRHCTAWMLYRALSDALATASPPRQLRLLRGLPNLFQRDR